MGSPFLNTMFQLERNAEFLSEIRASLDTSEERAAEQELRDRKSFFRRRVCEEFGKFLGLILNASPSARARHRVNHRNARDHVRQAIRRTMSRSAYSLCISRETYRRISAHSSNRCAGRIELSAAARRIAGMPGRLTLYCYQPNCFGIHVD